MNYCEVCGVLIANAPPGAPATICERCFASRKVLVAPDSDDVKATDAPDRVQFACPACRSTLQLPPVKKRTKIKCPQCKADFAMHPDGKIEGNPPRTGKLETQKLNEKLLGDLKPARELDDLLAKVPEKKAEVLPSVLDSDGVLAADSGSSAPLQLAPSDVGPGDANKDYELLPESAEKKADFPESKELDPVKDEAPAAKPKKLQTVRRTKDKVYEDRREKEIRAQRALEAQKYTIALLEKRRARLYSSLRLAALIVAPLLVGGLFLISTTQEGGFAVRGALGRALTSVGETARQGVEGVQSLVGGK